MKYYSTNGEAPIASLEKAVIKGLAEDKGLYMPDHLNPLPKEFFDTIENKREIPLSLRFYYRAKGVSRQQ